MNYFASTATDPEWGTLVNLDIEDARPGDSIRYVHFPADDEPIAIIVAVPHGADVSLGTGARTEIIQNEGTHNVWVAVGHVGPIEINITAVEGQEWASLGFARRGWKDRAEDAFRRFVNKCRACKVAVRFAMNVATGGGDMTGEAMDLAAQRIEELLGDTILDEILDILRRVLNPGKWIAAEVCRRLGYCT